MYIELCFPPRIICRLVYRTLVTSPLRHKHANSKLYNYAVRHPYTLFEGNVYSYTPTLTNKYIPGNVACIYVCA